jgi:DNA helicase-2/ATP-dependent DNA helicase PcrA
VKSDIQKLMADGAKPEQIVVLARTRALLAPVEAALLAVNISTQQLGKARNIKHVMAALGLIRIVERCQRQQTEITAELLRKALPSLTPVDDSIWLREARALAKAMRVTSLEGRYRLCAAGYLRLMGGVRANAELRADLNRWEPFSRGYAHAREMRVAVRAMAPAAVVTGTIHAAKGMEWPHVLVLGVTDGLLPLYLARDTAALAEERNLLYVAITRAEQSLRLYHAPVTHARSGHQFEGLSRFIDRPSVRRLIGQDARKRR